MRTAFSSSLSSLVLVAGAFAALPACGKKPPLPAPATQAATQAATAAAPTTPATADAGVTDKPTAALEADAGAAVADTAAPAPVASDDLLVWTTTADGRQTTWVHGDEVAATRPEAVTVADGKLWALGERWRVLKEYPCKQGGDDDFAGDRTKAPRLVAVATLWAKELGGEGGFALLNGFPDADAEFDGEIWNSATELEGAIGGHVFVSGVDGLYACGAAHGLSDGKASVIEMKAKARGAIEASEALKQKVADAIKAAGKADDCLSDTDTVDPVAPDTLELRFAEGHASATWIALRAADAEWNHACDLEAKVPAPPDATLGLGPFDPRLEKVLATQKGTGTFGFATVPADRREALLELFRKEPPSFTAKPEVPDAKPSEDAGTAAALVNQGRKLTQAKDFASAIAAFDGAIAKDAKLAPAYSGRAYAKMLSADPAGARADFEKALTLETKDAAFQAAVWFNLGQLAEKAKDLAAAKTAYEKAIGFKPSEGAKKALLRVSK